MHLDRLGKGVKPGLSRTDAYRPVLCVPPLAEQHRIVAKVEKLMALCDRLEAARAKREATRNNLTAASLVRLNAPDPETFREYARFALDALPALTARADQIKQLSQTVLNLAVRGKLVPQDPKEGTGGDLLRQPSKLRNQSRIASRRKRDVSSDEIRDEDKYFETSGLLGVGARVPSRNDTDGCKPKPIESCSI
ncbi:MAG: hypothetical protein ACREFZ_04875 [Acetobacteraceae bacterium]